MTQSAPASDPGPAPLRCPQCALPVPASAAFCANCGARLARQPTQEAAHRLSERKFVTIAFFDMVGSLEAIQDKDPEDAHELLAAAMRTMTEAVHAYGGVVIDRQGDGIVAIFGAPAAQDDHAVRACLAALRLQAIVAAQGKPGFEFRVGINSGEVAIGSAASDFTFDYTATGAVVHIAARLQGLAAKNSAVMSAQTAALVQERMQTVPMGEAVLKGLPAPVEIHALAGPAKHGAAGAAVHRPFVGRAAVLERLASAMASAARGQGCAIALIGEAGIGKTTVLDQFASRHRGQAQLVRVNAQHHSSVGALHPFAEIVQQLLRLPEAGPQERRDRLWQGLADLGLDPIQHATPLADLLDIPGLPPEWRAHSPQLRQDLIGSSVLELLLRQGQRRRTVIVLDDLQRADTASLQLVGRLVRDLAGSFLFVLVAFRPELDPGWLDALEAIDLRTLSEDETRALIATLLGDVAPAVEQHLVRWSRGNPLFLRERLRALAESGAVRDPEAAASMAIPPSISAAIAMRIDRLAPAAKRLLLAASVLGEQFDARLLAHLAGLEPAALAPQLAALVGAEFLREVEPATGTYAFEHGLFREVGYGTLVRQQRRDLHRSAFATLHHASQGGTLEEKANHAYCGELWEQGTALCWEAGRRAAERYSNSEAAYHFERAIIALVWADPHGERIEDAIQLRLDLRSVCIPLLRVDRMAALLREAHEMAGRLQDVSHLARITGFLAGYAYFTGDTNACLRRCHEALRLARRAGDPALRIAPTIYLAQAQYGLGRYRQTAALLQRQPAWRDETVAGSPLGLPAPPLLIGGYWLAIACAELGRFPEAEALVATMLQRADLRQPFELLYAQTAQGFVQLLRGRLDAALAASSAALEIAEKKGIPFILPVLASQTGYLLARQGRVDEGLALARLAIRKTQEIGSAAGRSRWHARLAEACLAAGELEEARRQTEDAVAIAQAGAELGYLCSALRLRAKVRVLGADLAGAATDLNQATAAAVRTQSGPALAKCHFDTGALALRCGDVAQAREAFHKARAVFQYHEMEEYAARSEAALVRLESGEVLPVLQAFIGSAE
ncbi:MAG TPA: AAA family ATPase [Ramlibacter sp.]